eukprot:scaffold14015_cov112-Isochrysis_galbana.AAC.2
MPEECSSRARPRAPPPPPRAAAAAAPLRPTRPAAAARQTSPFHPKAIRRCDPVRATRRCRRPTRAGGRARQARPGRLHARLAATMTAVRSDVRRETAGDASASVQPSSASSAAPPPPSGQRPDPGVHRPQRCREVAAAATRAHPRRPQREQQPEELALWLWSTRPRRAAARAPEAAAELRLSRRLPAR